MDDMGDGGDRGFQDTLVGCHGSVVVHFHRTIHQRYGSGGLGCLVAALADSAAALVVHHDLVEAY
jgi:hypothetical protein